MTALSAAVTCMHRTISSLILCHHASPLKDKKGKIMKTLLIYCSILVLKYVYMYDSYPIVKSYKAVQAQGTCVCLVVFEGTCVCGRVGHREKYNIKELEPYRYL